MPPNPRSLRAIRREFRVYFQAVLVQIELESKRLGWNSQKSVWVFQDLAPQRCPKKYSQDDTAVPVNAIIYPKSTSRFLGSFADFDVCRDSVSADPGSGPFWPSTFEDAMVWDRTCLENGPIFASAASQSTLNQRDSGLKCFTLRFVLNVSDVGSFESRPTQNSVLFPGSPAPNRGPRGHF